MLYVFAGFPKCGLNAGGLRQFIQNEELGLLEEDPAIQYHNDGETPYHMSEMTTQGGIGWSWFTDNWSFGNGVTIHKTTADYDAHHVTLNQALASSHTEGRAEYEARWKPNMCPQQNHVVHMTWCVFQHRLPEFAYDRLRAIIEDGVEPMSRTLYETPDEPGLYYSAPRTLSFGSRRK